MIHFVGPRDYPPGRLPAHVIDTTSRSDTWSRGLSPFYLGPVDLYPGAVLPQATNVENAWQGSKCYALHVDPFGRPAPAYYDWARTVWSSPKALRYPMGKGTVPAFSWWSGRALDYITARREIYIPTYARAVLASPAFAQLLSLYRMTGELTLWDFDCYDRGPSTYQQIAADPHRKMGHAFVLGMLLDKLADSR